MKYDRGDYTGEIYKTGKIGKLCKNRQSIRSFSYLTNKQLYYCHIIILRILYYIIII